MAGTAVRARARGRVGHEPKDKNSLSPLKHRARHDRLTSLPVSDVLSFARISPLPLFLCSARRSQVIETARKSVERTYREKLKAKLTS